MSKSVKMDEAVYNCLTEMMWPKETYSEVIGRLLLLQDKVDELINVMETRIATERRKSEALQKGGKQ